MLSSCLLRLQLSPVTLSSLPNLSTSGSHGSLSPLPKPSTFGTHAFHSIRRALLPIRRRTHLPESRKWRELDLTCFYKPKDKLEASSSEKHLLEALLQKLCHHNIRTMADIVINHRVGTTQGHGGSYNHFGGILLPWDEHAVTCCSGAQLML